MSPPPPRRRRGVWALRRPPRAARTGAAGLGAQGCQWVMRASEPGPPRLRCCCSCRCRHWGCAFPGNGTRQARAWQAKAEAQRKAQGQRVEETNRRLFCLPRRYPRTPTPRAAAQAAAALRIQSAFVVQLAALRAPAPWGCERPLEQRLLLLVDVPPLPQRRAPPLRLIRLRWEQRTRVRCRQERQEHHELETSERLRAAELEERRSCCSTQPLREGQSALG